MSAQNTSSWWKHDANMATELRFCKLRSLLRDDPYALICRLYDFAATMRQDGNLSTIDDSVLALRLEHKGSGTRLRRILTESEYLDATGQIVGWHDDRFRLYDSIRKQNRDRAQKSVQVRAAKSVERQAVTAQSDKEDSIGEERTVAAERPAERPVQPVADSPSCAWPNNLQDEQLTAVSRDTGKSTDLVATLWTRYRDRKIHYNDRFSASEGLAGFRDYVRQTRDEVPRDKSVPLEAPVNWREALERVYPGNGVNSNGSSWTTLATSIQREVIQASNML